MTKLRDRPVLHGRDHATGGADPIPGIGGIQFDVENDGGWLYVTTEDATEAGGSPTGHGILLDDFSGGGVYLAAHSGGIFEIHTVGGGDVVISSSNDLTVGPLFQDGGTAVTRLSGQGVRVLNNDGSGHATIGSTGLDVYLRVFDDKVMIDYGGNDDTPGSPLLEIDVAGGGTTYHILSGASWVADL